MYTIYCDGKFTVVKYNISFFFTVRSSFLIISVCTENN